MRSIATARRLAVTAVTALAAVLLVVGGQLAMTAQAASASGGVGWVRLCHLSPNTPAVDVYLYSFGNPDAQLVLRHVAYGTVSPFEQLAAGEYTVAMRLAGAAASSKPVLSTTVDVASGHAYTVAGLGPASGLRLEVISDPLTTASGKGLVQVIQASLKQDVVSVDVGSRTLVSGLKFGDYTGFHAVSPGTLTVRASGSSETATATISLAAGTIHTLVVLDAAGGLAIDNLLDAAGSKVAPTGPAQTGFGGTAARPGAPLLPWVAVGIAGLLFAGAGAFLASRRRRPALHAR
jgi:hypothetical protein